MTEFEARIGLVLSVGIVLLVMVLLHHEALLDFCDGLRAMVADVLSVLFQIAEVVIVMVLVGGTYVFWPTIVHWVQSLGLL